MLNFEPVDYDYSLEDDKMPPRVQYSKYADAPIRQQTYPYVRAQRIERTGTTNPKIVHHDKEESPQVNTGYEWSILVW